MEFREALDIARQNPGAIVTRGPDGQFIVLRADGGPFPIPDPAKDELDRLQRDNAFLQRRYDELCEQLEGERRAYKTHVVALSAMADQLQLAKRAAVEALAVANKTKEDLRKKIGRVSAEEWERIKPLEEEERQAYLNERRAERHTYNCSCLGEVENCARCDGRGSYTADGFGNTLYV